MTKKAGRVKKVCSNGSLCKGAVKPAEFSTHSSNRTVCHACQPKCREIHLFGNHPTAIATRKAIEAAAKKAAQVVGQAVDPVIV